MGFSAELVRHRHDRGFAAFAGAVCSGHAPIDAAHSSLPRAAPPFGLSRAWDLATNLAREKIRRQSLTILMSGGARRREGIETNSFNPFCGVRQALAPFPAICRRN